MDPVTTAIIAAVNATEIGIGKKIFEDAYQGLKSLIQSKLGQNNNVSTAIVNVEAEPESKGQQIVLSERVAVTKASQDKEILNSAENLITQINKIPGGKAHIMSARENFFFQVYCGSRSAINRF